MSSGARTRPFVFDRRFELGATTEEVWSALSDPRQYPRWWSWLERCEVDGPLARGTVAHAVIRAPLPYRLELGIEVRTVRVGEVIETEVHGDLAGPARLELGERGGGCDARLTWSLELRDPVLRRLAPVARPLMSWGHDRVVELGLRQFRAGALEGAS